MVPGLLSGIGGIVGGLSNIGTSFFGSKQEREAYTQQRWLEEEEDQDRAAMLQAGIIFIVIALVAFILILIVRKKLK